MLEGSLFWGNMKWAPFSSSELVLLSHLWKSSVCIVTLYHSFHRPAFWLVFTKYLWAGLRRRQQEVKGVMLMPVGHTAGPWGPPLLGGWVFMWASSHLMCGKSGWSLVRSGRDFFSSSAMTWCFVFRHHWRFLKWYLSNKSTNVYWALTLCQALFLCFMCVDWVNPHHRVMW